MSVPGSCIGILHGDGVLRTPLHALAAEDAAEAVYPPEMLFSLDGEGFSGAVLGAEGAEGTGGGIEADMPPGCLEESGRSLRVHLTGGLPEEVSEGGLEHCD